MKNEDGIPPLHIHIRPTVNIETTHIIFPIGHSPDYTLTPWLLPALSSTSLFLFPPMRHQFPPHVTLFRSLTPLSSPPQRQYFISLLFRRIYYFFISLLLIISFFYYIPFMGIFAPVGFDSDSIMCTLFIPSACYFSLLRSFAPVCGGGSVVRCTLT